jgi:photosystem II stability/assembly factor-like uncharacterized protein
MVASGNSRLRKALHTFLLLGLLLFTVGADSPRAAGISSSGNARTDDVGRPTDLTAQTQTADELRDFGLVSGADGWILTGSHLYWKTDQKADWDDITPALPASATIHAVEFLDSEAGWVLWADTQADGGLVLELAHTADRGITWNSRVIQTLAPDDLDANVERASMDWLDENTGWVSIKQKTGVNFSAGMLFRTRDGGQTWTRLSLPVGEPVHFVDSRVGWIAGGPAGDQLYKTLDGGETWEKQSVPGSLAGERNYSLYPPVFDSPENGLLALVARSDEDFQLEIYTTRDGGQNWSSVYNLPLGSKVSRPPLSLLDAQDFMLPLPNSDRIFHMADGVIATNTNRDGMSIAIVELKMQSSVFGWARWNTASCTTRAVDGSNNISCSSTTQLIQTRDGGITWQPLALPGSNLGLLVQSTQAVSPSFLQTNISIPEKTLQVVGQAFDTCEIPTQSQLQSWWNYGPYKAVNLYIGGAARYCPNTALTRNNVTWMRAQGWTFLPTWVGPQAPCYSYGDDHINYDVAQAYLEGRDEASKAMNVLLELGLAKDDKTDSVVYYDMEGYGSDEACHTAVKAFLNGWVDRLHGVQNFAGIYSSAGCGACWNDFMVNPTVPDVIWPALWSEDAYVPDADFRNLDNHINTAGWNGKRIFQYASDHSETWGGVTLKIDSNVLDGVVAVPYFGTPFADFSASILSGIVPFTARFTIANTAFMEECSWDYGDGQTGRSCAYIHNHRYASPGIYTVSLTVSSPWGSSDSLTRDDYITAIFVPYHLYIPLVIQLPQ